MMTRHLAGVHRLVVVSALGGLLLAAAGLLAPARARLERSAASDAMRALREIRGPFAGLAVYPDNFHALAKGLRRCYRATRTSFQQALVTERDEDLHEWRKGVQHHWRQMQLLAPCWPSELTARVDAARSISQLLGDDHDISLLRQLVSTPTMTFGSPEETAAFLKRCRKRHKALRKEAAAPGRAAVRRAVASFRRAHRSLLAGRRQRGGKPAVVEPRARTMSWHSADLRTTRAG